MIDITYIDCVDVMEYLKTVEPPDKNILGQYSSAKLKVFKLVHFWSWNYTRIFNLYVNRNVYNVLLGYPLNYKENTLTSYECSLNQVLLWLIW